MNSVWSLFLIAKRKPLKLNVRETKNYPRYYTETSKAVIAEQRERSVENIKLATDLLDVKICSEEKCRQKTVADAQFYVFIYFSDRLFLRRETEKVEWKIESNWALERYENGESNRFFC